MAKKTYSVQSPIKHDGKEYAVGEQIDLDDKEAKELLEVKAIEQGTGALDNTPVAPTDAAERSAAIIEAIGKLDKADASLWTNAGVPKTEAITAVTGWPVSAKERDAVWAEISAAK